MVTITTPTPKAIYVHIPFCTNKCHYCDFTAYVVKGQPVDAYLDALEREMIVTTEQLPPAQIETIFIGGGTPTILEPEQMERLLANLKKYFPQWASTIEVTVEANPGTTGPELLAAMYEGGVNRLSMGVQTFRPELLRAIGRIHSVDDVYRSVQQARKAGFSNLSLDLMFGLPKQTKADMEHTLREAVALEPEHFSVYSLKVEEGTPFDQWQREGRLQLPHEEEELAMYQVARSYLQAHGYPQYEVSNFAQVGRKSEHNLVYWRNQPFYGLGAGAHGYTDGVRHSNVRTIQGYIDASVGTHRPRADEHEVTREEAMENQLILGLRLAEGVSKYQFERKFSCSMEDVFGEIIHAWIQSGHLQWEQEHLKLTEQGLLFGNDVFAAFLGEAIITN
ncbi:radical SAM family heme chaperone HemW [Mechercharimyces sp. CAU 1602]|uniref:radical SAM family heme chaperone HemW n=1 Tax=Mechercharimyces sp. CAU 1602 TaxID=2973933 RepID=UPI002162798D|nr:radical SAM family heme chaperone HemW [Mechercharimyces sp. CAU 1602]MCS1350445.1 radical SAM family heme chaperone HemW [Mechercharimyces sp. CAU 1602]